MFNIQTPLDFKINQELEGYSIEYLNLMEIAQGGPEVGEIKVNGKKVNSQYPFGGPCVVKDKQLYIPIFIRKVFVSGFKVCKINLETFERKYIGKVRSLIFLDKVENERVYYFEDINKTKSSYFNL